MSIPDRPIAYIALTSGARVQNDLLEQHISRWMVGQGHRVAVRLAGAREQRGDAIMMVGPVPMPIMYVEAPLPDALIIDDIGQDRAWPRWRDAIRAHRAHLVVAPLMSEAERVASGLSVRAFARQAAACTYETACALAGLDDAVGVVWGPAKLIGPSPVFADPSAARRRSKADLLVRLRWFGQNAARGVADDGRGLGACTKGLSLFADRELLHPATGEPSEIVRDRLLGLADLLILHGAVLEPGNTVGGIGGARFRVAADRAPTGEAVFRLDLEHPAFA